MLKSYLPDTRPQHGFIEGFCGAGGMTLGLQRAGLVPLLAFDIDAPAVQTHNNNLGGHAFVGDAREVTGPTLLNRAGISQGELALFAGGPPCQGFSKQRRGGHLGDERNDLVGHYIRLIEEIKPRFFFFENVAIFGQKRGREYVREMYDRLTGYIIDFSFVNSADYGLAQTRERFLVVGRRLDQQVSFTFPAGEGHRWPTVGEVLRGLPEPPNDYSEHPKYANHQRARVTEENIRRFSFVPEGGGWQDIPYELRLPCHQRVDTSSGGWPDVYGRLAWNGQCPTITGGFDSFTRGRYGHPKADRPLTPREAARLQGFPDSFRFIGTRADIRSQIGNAVPPPLAEAVGLEILRSLRCADGCLVDDRPANSLCETATEYGTNSRRRRKPASLPT
ncbi:MAG: DNA cytosine methyltransferase [Prosthecobacter sp.]|jgi:DNA (cytosine-5)-methyltransferase 1|uniref:DNA cytosine methyltransferase n=1 Tax=Prosthecobacter sp. TaxID=1965333 RepID=UPI001A0E8F76|nr:DNA cytosine methyltransferase [Prosthecobacter sp.]MBE2283586.1 DNA cytosine methyltransferase [Prosthecobacter sp.]